MQAVSKDALIKNVKRISKMTPCWIYKLLTSWECRASDNRETEPGSGLVFIWHGDFTDIVPIAPHSLRNDVISTTCNSVMNLSDD